MKLFLVFATCFAFASVSLADCKCGCIEPCRCAFCPEGLLAMAPPVKAPAKTCAPGTPCAADVQAASYRRLPTGPRIVVKRSVPAKVTYSTTYAPVASSASASVSVRKPVRRVLHRLLHPFGRR